MKPFACLFLLICVSFSAYAAAPSAPVKNEPALFKVELETDDQQEQECAKLIVGRFAVKSVTITAQHGDSYSKQLASGFPPTVTTTVFRPLWKLAFQTTSNSADKDTSEFIAAFEKCKLTQKSAFKWTLSRQATK
jgi:hypothetical protein